MWTYKKIKWICAQIEKFAPKKDKYKLIISQESFHLFPNPSQIIEKCVKSLQVDSYLCIGWINYAWETILKESMIDIFSNYNITWVDWGYWGFPDFPKLVANHQNLSSVSYKFINKQTNIHIHTIARYLLYIDKTSTLSNNERENIFNDLVTAFEKKIPSKMSNGITVFNLAFCRRI